MGINTAFDLNGIICAVIQAGGAIAAAVWAAHIAREVVKKDIKPLFQSYNDKSYDFSDVIGKAQHNIVIIAASGFSFLKHHKRAIKKKLRSGVSVYYLFLDKDQFKEMRKYTHGEDGEGDCVEKFYSPVEKTLKKLLKKYPAWLRVKVFPHFMTASYVGVDIPFPERGERPLLHSAIQIMPYQYLCAARESPISYIYYNQDKKLFMKTINSMKDMWDESKKLKVSNMPLT